MYFKVWFHIPVSVLVRNTVSEVEYEDTKSNPKRVKSSSIALLHVATAC